MAGDLPMETVFGVLKPRRSFVTVRLSLAVLTRWRDALLESRKREKLRAALDGLSDRELLDIGIGRGEVDHVASNRAIDPRGAVLPP
jgi:uncharacterized protein YjiS (DUF1127 family)